MVHRNLIDKKPFIHIGDFEDIEGSITGGMDDRNHH